MIRLVQRSNEVILLENARGSVQKQTQQKCLKGSAFLNRYYSFDKPLRKIVELLALVYVQLVELFPRDLRLVFSEVNFLQLLENGTLLYSP